MVIHSGSIRQGNHHSRSPDQRHAYDLSVVRGVDEVKTDGTTNEDFFAWGTPVVAPAAGRIVTAVDGWPDIPPGTDLGKDPNAKLNPLGNHVVIDHGDGRYSFLAHFQEGSVLQAAEGAQALEVGGRVEAGQRLGLVGNSGNTTAPHLHFHVQSSPVFGWGAIGEGLPAPLRYERLGFLDYSKPDAPVFNDDQRIVEQATPTRFEVIRNP